MKRSMILVAAVGLLTVAVAGCGPSGTSESSTAPAGNAAETPPPAPMASSGESGGGMAAGSTAATGDSAAEKKFADLDAKLAKSSDDAKLKKEVAAAAYEAGHYIEYDKPGLTPREKYRPSLKLYRRALELDPKHEKAAFEAKQIEDIYKQMGMPVP